MSSSSSSDAEDSSRTSSVSNRLVQASRKDTRLFTAQPEAHRGYLLAAVLENICRLYDSDPVKSERLFNLICQPLKEMGILTEEHAEEMSGVRKPYQEMFAKLWKLSTQSVDSEDCTRSRSVNRNSIMYHVGNARPKESKRDCKDDSYTYSYGSGSGVDVDSIELSDSSAMRTPSLHDDVLQAMQRDASNPLSAFSTSLKLLPQSRDFFEDLILRYQDSRYKNDFEEISMLGKGGFGSVFRARNIVDGREYAVKKIVIPHNNMYTGGRSDYEQAKVYREIRTLARLEHVNIIRYFGAWKEHTSVNRCSQSKSSLRRQYSKQKTDKANQGRALQPAELDFKDEDDLLFPMDDNIETDSLGVVFEKEHEEDSKGIYFEDDPSASGKKRMENGSHHNYNNRSQPPPKSDTRSWRTYDLARNGQAMSPINFDSINRFEEIPSSMPSRSTMRLSRRFSHSMHKHSASLQYGSILSDLSNNKGQSPSETELETTNHEFLSASLPLPKPARRRASSSPARLKLETLYIQMHLCPFTLRDYIKIRDRYLAKNTLSLEERETMVCSSINLFKGILEGSHYIHKAELCHRDIKPSNIFLAKSEKGEKGAVELVDYSSLEQNAEDINVVVDGSGTQPCHSSPKIWVIPKLGDFGLVLPAGEEDQEEDEGVGTAIYAAPEQLYRTLWHGNLSEETPNKIAMSPKCDVFALGVTFLEMLQPCSTGMERARLLEDLRRGILPEPFISSHGVESAVILAMTCVDPLTRPTVEGILNSEMMNNMTEFSDSQSPNRMNMLEVKLIRAEKENRALREQLDDVHALKRRIRELEISGIKGSLAPRSNSTSR